MSEQTTSVKQAISEFQIVDHGLEPSQYFEGCGVALTKYAYVVTGVGDNCEEALNDALEQMACDDWDVSAIEASEEVKQYQGEVAREQLSVAKHIMADPEEWNYYLSIRWN